MPADLTFEPAVAPVAVNAPVVNADSGILPLGPPVIVPQSDVEPADPERVRIYPATATHIVRNSAVGGLVRGDGLSAADLATGLPGITRLVGLNAIRPMTAAELAARPAAAVVAPVKTTK